jgi:hypothetical protein
MTDLMSLMDSKFEIEAWRQRVKATALIAAK